MGIRYNNWIEIKFRLNNEDSKDVTVPFLVIQEKFEQPVVGCNVIELFVKRNR